MCGANDVYPAASSAQATANIRSAIRHSTALDNLYCSTKSSSPRLLWPSFSSIERCATTRKACSTAILAATMAGNATAPPPNAITRIAAAMHQPGQCLEEPERPKRHLREGLLAELFAERDRHRATMPAEA